MGGASAHIGDGEVTLYTRTGKAHAGSRFPKVEAELLATFPKDSWVDGELVALTEAADVPDNWGTVQEFAGSKSRIDTEGVCSYGVFDVLALSGTDARSLTLQSSRSYRAGVW